MDKGPVSQELSSDPRHSRKYGVVEHMAHLGREWWRLVESRNSLELSGSQTSCYVNSVRDPTLKNKVEAATGTFFVVVFLTHIFFIVLIYQLVYYIPTLPHIFPPPHPFPPPPPSLCIPPLFPFRRWQASKGCQPNLAYQVAISLGTSTHIAAGQATQRGPQSKQKHQSKPLVTLFRALQKHQATQ